MVKVGLTGGIGSGKSTVSNLFRKEQIKIIDADVISREVLLIYPEIKISIIGNFGEKFFDLNGNLKRRELGDFIFKDECKRKRLEGIMIPYIKKEISLRFKNYEESGNEICILDAPTLIEQGIYKDMDKNILVWVDRETQVQRVKKRDNLREEQVINRIESQISLDDKKMYVDFVVDNSKDLLTTTEQINIILTLLEKDEG